jgi:Secretion system C-terminal sorting domain/Family of unknown function (DUF5689)
MSISTIKQLLKNALPILLALLAISFVNIYSQDITSLDSLKTNDTTGVSLFAGDPSVNITGIVTSTIQPGYGTVGPSTIQGPNTAIAIYSVSSSNSFSSTSGVKIGDSVVVTNLSVSPYNGFTELDYTASSAVQIISSNHVVKPTVITIADLRQGWNGFEKYESMLVQINNVTFIDTAKTFNLLPPYNDTGYSYLTDGTDTVEFYFTVNCSGLVGKPIPSGKVSVVGIAEQYDKTAPYNSGYEIVPLDSSAIMTTTAIKTLSTKNYSYKLFQNYPNPFNPSTTISFSVPFSQKVVLSVYDVMGRKVATLFNAVASSGVTNVNFKADNLASGIYFYTIKTNSVTISKKLMLLK